MSVSEIHACISLTLMHPTATAQDLLIVETEIWRTNL